MQVITTMAAYTKVTTGYAIKDAVAKGTSLNQHIIVGTPGTLTDLIRRRSIDTTHVKIFVVDEADNMLDQQGLGDQTLRVKKSVRSFPSSICRKSERWFPRRSSVPRDCQIVLFSATFPDHVRNFANKFAPSANEIRLKKEELSVEGIKQFYMDCKNEDHKYEVLVELYSLLTIGQSIIFCKVRLSAFHVPCSVYLTQRCSEKGDGRCYFSTYDCSRTPSLLTPWK